MDSSDILRKIQAKTIYKYYKDTSFAAQGINTVTAATAGPPSTLTLANHGLNIGDTIVFASIGAGVSWSTTPALSTLYYIVSITANTFSFSATSGGTALSWTGTFSSFPKYYGPSACMNHVVGCTSLTPCISTYPSYEVRQQVITGAQACAGCSKTGCGCSS